MFEHFTKRSHDVFSRANADVVARRHAELDSLHLLLALLTEPRGVLKNTLDCLGVESSEELAGLIGRHLAAVPEGCPTRDPTPLSSSTKQALKFAMDEANDLGCHYIGPTHLLLGVAREDSALSVDRRLKILFEPASIRDMLRQCLTALGIRAEGAGLDEIETRGCDEHERGPCSR